MFRVDSFNCLDSFLLLNIIESVCDCHVHLFLVLWLVDRKLVADDVPIAIDAKVFQFTLSPDLFVQSLCPGLVLIVVTYHLLSWRYLKLMLLQITKQNVNLL